MRNNPWVIAAIIAFPFALIYVNYLMDPAVGLPVCFLILLVIYTNRFGKPIGKIFSHVFRETRSFYAESMMKDPYYEDWFITGWVAKPGYVLVSVQRFVQPGALSGSLMIDGPVTDAYCHYHPSPGDRLRFYGRFNDAHGLMVNDTVLFWHNILQRPVNILDTEDVI